MRKRLRGRYAPASTLDRLRSRSCWSRSSSACVALVQDDGASHTDHAVALVPTNALLYAHCEVDRNSGQWRNAGEDPRQAAGAHAVARPGARRACAAGRSPKQLDASVRPWIGDEAALALLPSGRRATSLDPPEGRRPVQAAKSFLAGAGRSRDRALPGHPGAHVQDTRGRVRGATSWRSGASTTCTRRSTPVRAVRSPRTPSSATPARGSTWEDRCCSPMRPGDGVRRLLQEQQGLVGRLGDALARPALRGDRRRRPLRERRHARLDRATWITRGFRAPPPRRRRSRRSCPGRSRKMRWPITACRE